MNFFKILFQSGKSAMPLYEQIFVGNALIGKNGYSFGIQYSPESYNNWLLEEKIFEIFIQSVVKQLLMTNYKFLSLANRQDSFHLNLVDCKLKNIDIEYLLQGEDISPEILSIILKDQEYQIMQMYFRSRDKHMITLKSNGVLGIDNDLNEDEVNDIKKLIDFLVSGPVVLK